MAAASAVAWDNGVHPYFPELDPNSPLYQHVFFRCNPHLPKKNLFRIFQFEKDIKKPSFSWKEPSYSYHPIPYKKNMKIKGYFQSEKYFAHHRQELLELFSPHPDDLVYIEQKYGPFLSHPQTVGIQLRYYKWEFPTDTLYPQYGKEYLEAAMSLFPPASLFIVSSNNIPFAKESIPQWAKHVIFLENEPNYIDLFILSRCKHNIITNSSFGWWAAWLNENPNKVIIRPSDWINGYPCQDVCPESWISLSAPYR